MITLLFTLDSLMHFVHVGGVDMSLGGVIFLCILYVAMHFKPHLAKPVVSVTPIIFAQVWLGVATLGGSGLLLFLPRPWLAVEPLYITKMAFVLLVLLVGIILNVYAHTPFPRAGRRVGRKNTCRPLIPEDIGHAGNRFLCRTHDMRDSHLQQTARELFRPVEILTIPYLFPTRCGTYVERNISPVMSRTQS